MHRDYQGSILAITDTNGIVVEKRLFDAWGSLTQYWNISGTTTLPSGAGAGWLFLDRGYTGHEHLLSVGLINMNGRLYNPKLHRFIQPDNYVQDPSNTQNYNRYGYVLNNPLRYTDPTGEFTWSDLVAAAAIVAGVIVIIASDGVLTPVAQWLIGTGAAHFLGTYAMYASNGNKDWNSASNYIGLQSPTINIKFDWGGGGSSDKNGVTQQEPIVTPKSYTDGGGNGGGKDKGYDSWFYENQYFDNEGGLRVGTYLDFSPFKKLLSITIGEYRETGYTADYYHHEGNITKNYMNHYFEAGFAVGGGINYKYNLGEDRFESFSFSLFGFSAEYSKQSSYQRQFYIGLDTGYSLGIGVGVSEKIKGGWRWNW